MKENGKLVLNMEMELIFLPMVMFILDNTDMVSQTCFNEICSFLLQENHMDMDSTFGKMAVVMLENFKMD